MKKFKLSNLQKKYCSRTFARIKNLFNKNRFSIKSNSKPFLKNCLGSWVYLIVISLSGFALAYHRFGWDVLNPQNSDWLLKGGDSAMSYLGWKFFRGESWHFPPGLIQGYLAPVGTSIGYTDSLPLLAFPLKIFSNML